MQADPQAIGRYEIQGVLGRGAMGVVYLAFDPLLKRLVAIKTLRDAGEEDVAITMERFHREAEISARLNHPNIITVFDVGSDPQVGPFLAMEYIEGFSLAALARKSLQPDSAMWLLVQAMSALMAAQQAGIIHRDVKSENMLVSKEGRLKLMDFGIARRNESRLTQAGMVFGTPSYTAPELLVGGEPSPATDNYAFAVTAFEVFTGQLPFLGSSVASTLYKVVHEPPRIPEGMDPALAEVFHKALAKDPSERFPDLPSLMAALLQALPLSPEQRSRLGSMLEGDGSMGAAAHVPMVRTGQLPDLNEAQATQPSFRKLQTPEPEAAPAGRIRKWVTGGVAAAVVVAGSLIAWQATHRPTHPVEFRTDPPGAQVFLNGQPLGKTPLGPIPIRDDRASGVIRFELPGFEPLQERLEPDDKLLEFTLQRLPYEVQITTEPAGAEVFLNGEGKGRSPLRLSVPGSGDPELSLRLEGFEEWKAKLDRDRALPSPIVLTAATFQAGVVTEPKGADVWVDGKPVGRTPISALQLSAGAVHTLRAKAEGYEEWSGSFGKDRPLPRPIHLKPRLVKVEVATAPPGATLTLDGKPAGKAPATLEVTVLGTHDLRLSLEGYEPRTLTLEAGKPLPHPIPLVALKKAEPPKGKEEKKPGFFKRLFGGKTEPEKKDKP